MLTQAVVRAQLFKVSLVQLVKVFSNFITKDTGIFIAKMREAFALQKLLTIFSIKNIGIFQISKF